MSLPQIKKVLFVPGLRHTTEGVIVSISVGIVVEGKHSAPAYWGDHVWARPLNEDEDRVIKGWVQKTLAPALVGRTLTNYRDLVLLASDLTAALPDDDDCADVATPLSPQKISRRELFTGRVRSTTSASPNSSTRPPILLRPALRSCLEQAILRASAHERRITIAEFIADTYGLAPAKATIPLHAQLDTHEPLRSLRTVGPAIAAVGYQVTEGDPAQVLGEDCHILQRFVKGVRSYLLQVQPEIPPHIHLDLRGGMAELYGGQSGKLLGAASGLEQAAQPFPLRIENISGNADTGSADLLRELQAFVRFRKMNVTLVAGEINSAAQVAAVVETTGLQSVHVNGSAIGSPHQIIETIIACHERDLGVLLTAETGIAPRFLRMLAHIALATNPAFVGAAVDASDQRGLGALYSEMARTLAFWQGTADP